MPQSESISPSEANLGSSTEHVIHNETPGRQVVEFSDQEPSIANRTRLLEAANGASQNCSTLHVAFLALCAYVMVIVFGTTDLDLLVGKGVTLPVLGVAVPIVGFYAVVPFLVVLVHFNLLMQLQLLSRKLYAFDAVMPKEEGRGGLREQLHIFPYTYYLVGRPSPPVHLLMGFLVSVTIVLLPLLTLFALQMRFLAYQDGSITWAQRIAIWLDMGLVLVLWPIIMHPKDDWRAYWRDLIAAYIPHRRVWLAPALLFAGFTLSVLCVSPAASLASVCVYLISPLAMVVLSRRRTFTNARLYCSISLFIASVLLVAVSLSLNLPVFLLGLLATVPLAALWNSSAPRGAAVLLTSLLFGLSLPFALLADGEKLEEVILKQPKPAGLAGHSTFFCHQFLFPVRHLSLAEQVLFAKPAGPESLALIRSDEWREARRHIEPINLQGRSLRMADLSDVILVAANLRWAHLQGANLWRAHLEGANLQEAWLQNANLNDVNLQCAYMYGARLQGAVMEMAQLQGANLGGADLQGAIVRADLEGANLHHAQLQGADLEGVDLQGAVLAWASLQGADLQQVQLNGADLQHARIAGAVTSGEVGKASGELVDVRGVDVTPISEQERKELLDQMEHSWAFEGRGIREATIARLEQASKGTVPRLELYSCLAESTSPINCSERFNPEDIREMRDFSRDLHEGLAILSCQSPDSAEGILERLDAETQMPGGSPRAGLGKVLYRRMKSKKACPGLQGIDPALKKWLRDLAESGR